MRYSFGSFSIIKQPSNSLTTSSSQKLYEAFTQLYSADSLEKCVESCTQCVNELAVAQVDTMNLEILERCKMAAGKVFELWQKIWARIAGPALSNEASNDTIHGDDQLLSCY